ncbi:MAG TPA: hypothetical protein VK588_13235 [Chitinophagaceae bacterium]|nr:hypothetical protein [Chitinophagaceae bacterium]
MEGSFLCWLFAITTFILIVIVQIKLVTAIFIIRDNAIKQTELLESQNKMILAQINLTSNIADKLGVPADLINEATFEYGFEFENLENNDK